MACIKFSILFLLGLSMAYGESTRFTPKSCLDASYVMKMTQKGPLFGLIKQEFIIDKKNCLIRITHKKYMPKEWLIDVCREPVHIKVISATGIDVAKKENECSKKDNSRDTSDFCAQWFSMLDVIQDDGLIFAKGDRDNLESDHGKTYCSYLLVKKYLMDSITFSQYTEVPDIFDNSKDPKPEVLELPNEGEVEKKGDEASLESEASTKL